MGASDLSQLLKNLTILEALHKLPDGVALSTGEAAVFLRVSISTLERMRRKGVGPPYIQGGNKGDRGVNQSCTYLKGDLIKYQEAQKVTGCMAAAVRRGQAYLPHTDPTPKRSLHDLVTRRPFYVDAKGRIIGCVDETPLPVIISRLGQHQIEWLNPIHAASFIWIEKAEHLQFANDVRYSLQYALGRLDEIAPE